MIILTSGIDSNESIDKISQWSYESFEKLCMPYLHGRTKHLKRVKNREKLYLKKKKLGRKI